MLLESYRGDDEVKLLGLDGAGGNVKKIVSIKYGTLPTVEHAPFFFVSNDHRLLHILGEIDRPW